MINVYQLSDAVPAAMFGMFALWAAASRRHWFVRTAVVAALLVMLLIPAYEFVVKLGRSLFLVFGVGYLAMVATSASRRTHRLSRSYAVSSASITGHYAPHGLSWRSSRRSRRGHPMWPYEWYALVGTASLPRPPASRACGSCAAEWLVDSAIGVRAVSPLLWRSRRGAALGRSIVLSTGPHRRAT